MPLADEWEEYRPAHYRLKEYTPEQIERLSKRPDNLIEEALSGTSTDLGRDST